MIIVDIKTVSGRDVAHVTSRMVCSNCWGKLRWVPEIPGYTCSTPGCSCLGMLSERTVERREADDAILHRAAVKALAEAAGQSTRPAAKAASELLAELGY